MVTIPAEVVPGFGELGVTAFTTMREAGSFSLASTDPVAEVMGRWDALRAQLATTSGVQGIAIAPQVHGVSVLIHQTPWNGLLRTAPADGHATCGPGIAVAITIADCIPVFLAHPKGAIAMLHSGWKGTADNIVAKGIQALADLGYPANELHLHMGPGISGECFEVGSDVRAELLRIPSAGTGCVELKDIIEKDAREAGVRHITRSASCTKTHNDTFFSHRVGDAGRQVAVMALIAREK